MEPNALDTLDAIMAGPHTLAGDAESVEDEQLRYRLTGAVVGLRAAVLNARDQVLHFQEQYDHLASQVQANAEPYGRPIRAPQPPRMKWGCYQFDETGGLFCAACYDKQKRRVRIMRHNNEN